MSVSVTAMIVALSGHAAASDDAKRHAAFRQGVTAIEAEKWDDALAIYKKLWDEDHTYDVALSLGQVELNLKAYRDAAEHLAFGVKNIPPREDAAVAARAHHMLDVARKEVASIQIRVDRANAEVIIDGKAIGTSPLPDEIFVDPGSHLIEAKSAGSTPIQQAINLGAGKQASLNLAFGDQGVASGLSPNDAPAQHESPAAAVPQTAPPSAPALARDASAGDSTARTVVLVSGLGVTAVAAAVTVAFALQGSSAGNDADDDRARATAKFGPNPCSGTLGSASPECNDLRSALDRRESDNQTANVALFVAALAGVSTATLFVLWPRDGKRPEQALRLTPGIGRGAAGAALAGSF